MNNVKELSEKDMQQINGDWGAKECLTSIGTGIAGGAIKGGVAGTAFGLGGGNAGGAFVGAHLGAIGGSAVCIGGFLGRKY